MLLTIKNLQGYKLHATDGHIGGIEDCYFDDEKWTIRYLVIRAGSWLTGHDVLISPIAVQGFDHPEKVIYLKVDKNTVQNSPSINTAEPISRAHEREYFQYYGWPYYWGGPAAWGWSGVPEPFPVAEPPPAPRDWSREDEAGVHLRSAREIMGYHIHTQQQEFGHLIDFVIDNASWTITDLLIDTRNWWPSKHVLMPHSAVESVSWIDRAITVGLSYEQIQQAPALDPEEGLSEEFHRRVNEYYAREAAAVAGGS